MGLCCDPSVESVFQSASGVVVGNGLAIGEVGRPRLAHARSVPCARSIPCVRILAYSAILGYSDQAACSLQ